MPDEDIRPKLKEMEILPDSCNPCDAYGHSKVCYYAGEDFDPTQLEGLEREVIVDGCHLASLRGHLDNLEKRRAERKYRGGDLKMYAVFSDSK